MGRGGQEGRATKVPTNNAAFRSLSYDLGMNLAQVLPLSEMSVEEKLQAMEALWEDLSRNAALLESPAWHEEILRERDRQIEAGEASFMDWEQAKAHIRNRVS